MLRCAVGEQLNLYFTLGSHISVCMPKTSRALRQLPTATAALEKLGADLAVARLWRKKSLKTWAKRVGLSSRRCSGWSPETRRLALVS